MLNSSSHTDREGVDAVGDGGALEIKGDRVTEASEFGHGVKGTVRVVLERWYRCPKEVSYPVVSGEEEIRLRSRKNGRIGRTENIDVEERNEGIPDMTVRVRGVLKQS